MALTNQQLFTDGLCATGAEGICRSIRDTGVFIHKNALRPETIAAILDETGPMDLTINTNDVAPVLTENQVFFTNFLAKSKTAYGIVTCDIVIDVCDTLMGDYALAGKRIYTTKRDMHMQWHCDVERACESPDQVDATVFIFYLTDVDDGEWQYVDRSHLLGENFVGGAAMDKVIERRHGKDIRGAAGPKGTMIVYNGRTLHRAKPMVGKNPPPRTSLFFQVNRNIAAGEPMLLNAAFLDNLDPKRARLLNIGREPRVPIFPNANARKMGATDMERFISYMSRLRTEKSPPWKLSAAIDRPTEYDGDRASRLKQTLRRMPGYGALARLKRAVLAPGR